MKQLLQRHHRLRAALLHDADFLAAAPDLAPVMGHPKHAAGEMGEGAAKIQLQLLFQIAVQSGKGLVQ